MSPDTNPGGNQDRPVIFVPNRPDATPQAAAPNRPDAAPRPTVDTTTRNTPEADNDLRAQFALLEAQNRAMANITTALMEQQKTTMAAWAAERAANAQVVAGFTGQLTELATRTAEASVSLRETAQLQRENIMIPETEWPRNEAGWAAVIRAEITEHRKLGESPYSGYKWFQDLKIKPWLEAARVAERRPGWAGLREKLTTELVATQAEDQVHAQWKKQTPTLDAAEKLAEAVSSGGITLSPDMLIGLSHLAATEIKPWLVDARRVSDGLGPNEPMITTESREISRAAYVYLKFFGEWAEAKEHQLLRPGGVEDTMREYWKKGASGPFKGDTKVWDTAVSSGIKAAMEGGKVISLGKELPVDYGRGWVDSQEAQALNKTVVEKLGFGTDGKIKKGVLRQMFASASNEVKGTYAYQVMLRNVAALANDTDGLTMFDLLKVIPEKIEKPEGQGQRRARVWPTDFTHVNMFSDNVKKDQVAYTRWVVQGLTGSDYAEESALRFVTYTGEGAEMNVDGVPSSHNGDITWQVCHPERRRLSEYRKRRTDGVGPAITLGRYEVTYPNSDGTMHYGRFSESWIRGTKLVTDPDVDSFGKTILGLIREGKWFDQLPWDRLAEDTYSGDFLTQFNHSIATLKAVNDFDTPLVKDPRDALFDRMGGRNKNFQNGFYEWEQGDVHPSTLYPDRRWSEQEARDWKNASTAFEKRDAYAAFLFNQDFKRIGKGPWSPWMTYIVGMVAAHTSDDLKIPPEIESPTGIIMVERATVFTKWSLENPKIQGGKPVNEESIPWLLHIAKQRKFLTPNEELLVRKMFGDKFEKEVS